MKKEIAQTFGWRFWLLWVIATNIGFFSGLYLGNLFVQDTSRPLASSVFSGCFALLASFAQWLVLRRYIKRTLHWITSSVLGWVGGTFVLANCFVVLSFPISGSNPIWLISVALFAGAIIGLLQFRLLRKQINGLRWWWVPLSSFAWAIFFPGAVTGIALIYILRSKKVLANS